MTGPRFYVGLHKPYHAQFVERCMISVNRLAERAGYFRVDEWMMDSGAFTKVTRDGGYLEPVEAYATEALKWAWLGRLVAVVAEDYMCEPFVLEKTGLTVAEHQRLTVDRYCALRRLLPYRLHVLPVLQGYAPEEYADHVRQYGDLLAPGMWVGVGSVCKRNAKASAIVAVLKAIKAVRPDLRLHGFGIKLTSLADADVCEMLDSADSMAWSFSARKQGRNPNCWREAKRFTERVAVVTAGAVSPAQGSFGW
jgi:hypothetical protein